MSEDRAFTSKEVRQLTGLNRPVLDAWEKSGWFAVCSRERYARRSYSLVDLVALRVIALLREAGVVSLTALAIVRDFLRGRDGLEHLPTPTYLYWDGKEKIGLLQQPVSGLPLLIWVDMTHVVRGLKDEIRWRCE